MIQPTSVSHNRPPKPSQVPNCETLNKEARFSQSLDVKSGFGKRVEELTAEINELNDKYMRLLAEFDNYKRRSARDYDQLTAMANESLIKDIVEVRESFEQAFASNDKSEKFVDGMKLVFTKLNSMLEKHGLEVYGKPGNLFDPELHSAFICSPHESIPESHISKVNERGYKLKGKIIKHAQVVVSSGKPADTSDNKRGHVEP